MTTKNYKKYPDTINMLQDCIVYSLPIVVIDGIFEYVVRLNKKIYYKVKSYNLIDLA